MTTTLVPGANAPLPAPRVTVAVTSAASLDVSALLLAADGKVRSDADFVFYNAPDGPGVRYGTDGITVDTAAVPAGIQRIAVTASPDAPGATFAGQEPTAVVRDAASGEPLVAFTPAGLTTETALVVVELYRRGAEWKVRAVGQGYDNGLAGIATDFGVQVDEQPAQPAGPAPTAAPSQPAAGPAPTVADWTLPPPPGQTPPGPAAPGPTPPAPQPAPPASPAPPPPPASPFIPARADTPQPAPAPPPPGPRPFPFSDPAAAPQPAPAPPQPPGQPFSAPQPSSEPYLPGRGTPAAPEPQPRPARDPFAVPAPAAVPPAPGAVTLDKGRVSLQKGGSVSLVKEGKPFLSSVRMALGWEPARRGRRIDLDASVIAYDAQRREVDKVWFRHLSAFNGAIQHSGDNLTGQGEGDDEVVTVHLQGLPPQVSGLVFTVNSYSGQRFTEVANAYCRLVDATTNAELVRFALTSAAPRTGVLMCKLVRMLSGEWVMTAIGDFHDARSVTGMVEAGAAAL